MTDSRHTPHDRSRTRLLVRQAIAVGAVVAFAWGAVATAARGDGDPASDVLATQALFLPADAGIAAAQQSRLAGLLAGAARSGYEIRVAVIASSSDLGSVTELWRQPQTYARFLDQELSLVYRGPLLVVMPDGFGLQSPGGSVERQRSALAGVSISAGGAGLGAAALDAVQRLARASGHPVAVPPAAAPTVGASSGDAAETIVFAIGCVLIVFAWAASLRARPPRLPGRRRVSG